MSGGPLIPTELVTFLREATARPFVFGTWDCGRYVAAWIKIKTGKEPGLEYIATYQTPLSLARIVKKRGGLISLFDRSFSEVGLVQTSCPDCSDVVIVDAEEGPTGAIMVDPHKSARLSVRGLFFESVPVLAAWKV